jgi:hypothetical protein
MRTISIACLGALAFAGRPVAGAAQEQKIARAALPPAVERAVTATSQGATVRGFTREREKGETYYEAELLVAGHHKDVLFDTAGAVVEVEEEVSLDSLSAAVRGALTTRAAGGKITNVESLSKRGRLVAYEAHVVRKGKRSEIQVGPGGETLDHEE